jgi:nucleoside-diphosphate-sugar epimerase
VITLIIGCGYLGQRLGSLLRQRGERVLGTVRSQRRAAEISGLGIEPVIADVLKPDSLRALPAADRIFYCVGFDRAAGASMKDVYVDGLTYVLRCLPPSLKRLVYASSTGVYGQSDQEWVDEDSLARPRNESGAVCLEAEECLRAWAGAGQTSVVVLRFAGLYGPGRMVRRSILERGEPIPGDPSKFLNLIHIDDAARAAAAALGAAEPEPLYVVSDDRPVTRAEYYSRMAAVIGAREPRFENPGPAGTEGTHDATNKRIHNDRMKRGLITTLDYPDITTGLADAVGAGGESVDQSAAAGST